MEDRLPTPGQEGRVLITPEDGSAPFYAKVEMADNPTQAGTPLNKQTLLQDATCSILGIPNTSVPNDAFAKLSLGIGKYGYIIYVTYPDGSPAEGYTVNGATAPDGNTAITNAAGVAVAVSEEESITVGIISPYVDIGDINGVTIQSAGILTTQNITLQPIERLLTSSDTYEFSPPAKTADFCAVGAGGGSVATPGGPLASGGGGGYVSNLLNYSLSIKTFSVLIGAGGQPLNASGPLPQGNDGGTTSVSVGSNAILTANGGSGATAYYIGGNGNGKGGDATTLSSAYGSPGTGYKFNEQSQGVPGGGGGGASLLFDSGVTPQQPTGGDPKGGMGGYFSRDGNRSVNGTPGRVPGGGGGTGAYTGFAGGNGGVYVRAHYDTF